MTEKTAIKKPRTKSKAAQIRKLLEQGKLTPKQIAEKVGAPQPYVYVIRSKMRESTGLPSVAEKKIPVLGGIREVASEAEAKAHPTQPSRIDEIMQSRTLPTQSPALVPMHVMVEQPTFVERVKERIRAWFA